MNILAINFNHDGSAVILSNGDVAGYVNTERFSRLKKHPGVRSTDIENLLDQARLKISEVDLAILLNLNSMDSPDIPALHGSDLKETWPDFWIDRRFERVKLLDHVLPCVLSHGHHIHHAALAYYYSPFESAVSLALDPTGSRAYFFKGTRVSPRQWNLELVSPLVYTLIAANVFGNGLIGAGKLMGLAPYGQPSKHSVDYRALMKMPAGPAYARLVECTSKDAILIRESGLELNASLAYHAQAFLEYELLDVFRRLHKSLQAMGVEPNLCLSGGTALNSVANQRCFERSDFQNLFLHPACSDDGTPIGAALGHWHIDMKQPKKCRSYGSAMYSCREYDTEIPSALARRSNGLVVRETNDYISEAARLLADGKVIGWYQGASEIGPRALGNRSILADPRRAEMPKYLNETIKNRETFRPFAPSVLKEFSQEWFGIADSPFMLRVARVLKNSVPAITHVDGTARVQTIGKEDNPNYYNLIESFRRITGIPLVLNTSFNGKGEPIVETPDDAMNCLIAAKLDAVVFPGAIVTTK